MIQPGPSVVSMSRKMRAQPFNRRALSEIRRSIGRSPRPSQSFEAVVLSGVAGGASSPTRTESWDALSGGNPDAPEARRSAPGGGTGLHGDCGGAVSVPVAQVVRYEMLSSIPVPLQATELFFSPEPSLLLSDSPEDAATSRATVAVGTNGPHLAPKMAKSSMV